ncbi:hypothetical protein M501DRAFT_522755 [Patellaria atrata CBS 101060]|uniref:Uncharacterized protein n=1 Tax=Patellaria atrata CBS 101060 TaxID=1346257 RepID=A0A9P4S2Q5_9PEZI|nr:hypothetical protein M501DRAFT_522755 [Patellaria atrata CBS 101060]
MSPDSTFPSFPGPHLEGARANGPEYPCADFLRLYLASRSFLEGSHFVTRLTSSTQIKLSREACMMKVKLISSAILEPSRFENGQKKRSYSYQTFSKITSNQLYSNLLPTSYDQLTHHSLSTFDNLLDGRLTWNISRCQSGRSAVSSIQYNCRSLI